MKRLGSPMQPKAMQDVINALARVRSIGIPSIVPFISNNPLQLPTYHLAQILRLLTDWEKETHLKLKVRSAFGDTSLDEWILLTRLAQDRNDTMFRHALAGNSNLSVRLILSDFRDDESAVKEILGHMQPLASYHKELFDFLVTNSNLSALVLKVFSTCFDTFPESALLQAFDAPGIEFGALIRALATSSSPAHLSLHKVLVTKLLGMPLDLFAYREMAKVLRVHPTREIIGLLKNMISIMSANELWLVRAIEAEREELLVDEAGCWLG
jgi:hypothetical protein